MRAAAVTGDRSGWAGWDTGFVRTPPGHTETFPGCSPRGPRLTDPWRLGEEERWVLA